MKVKKAVIPAAGLGTRFLPASKNVPKELLPIVDKPSIQFIVEEAISSGIENVVLVTSRGKGATEDYFDVSYELERHLEAKEKKDLLGQIRNISSMVDLVTVRQKEPKGLGNAVLCASLAVGDEYFFTLLGDDIIYSEVPCCKQMREVMDTYGGDAVVAIMEVGERETYMYGIIEAEEIGEGVYEIKDMIEKPSPSMAPSNLAVIGRYLLPSRIFSILKETPPGSGGEIQLTDAIKMLAKEARVLGYRFKGLRFDAGDKLGFLKANVYFGLRHPDFGDALREYLKELV